MDVINDIALEILEAEIGSMLGMNIVEQDLATEDSLRTAVLISLFSDARASDDDPVDVGASKRGWWGDMLAQIDGDSTGSKLWLLNRAKQTGDNRINAEEYCAAALQWMIDDGVAQNVSVVATYPNTGILLIEVTITRPTGAKVVYTFDYAWKAEGAK